MYDCPICGLTFHHDDNPPTECGPNDSVICCPECAAGIEALTQYLSKDFDPILAKNNLIYFLRHVIVVDLPPDLSNSECYLLDRFSMSEIVDWVYKDRNK